MQKSIAFKRPYSRAFRFRRDLSGLHALCCGISVLTDEKYFQGKFEYLAYVTERVAQPVLNKDFFVDTYQVYLPVTIMPTQCY